MKSFTFIVAIATLIIGFSACERVSQIVQPTPPPMEDASGEISVGVVLPLTGHLASAGERMKQGFDLALGEINDGQLGSPQFTFIIEDDTSTAEGAVAAFNKLIHEGWRVCYSRTRVVNRDTSGFSRCARESNCRN